MRDELTGILLYLTTESLDTVAMPRSSPPQRLAKGSGAGIVICGFSITPFTVLASESPDRPGLPTVVSEVVCGVKRRRSSSPIS